MAAELDPRAAGAAGWTARSASSPARGRASAAPRRSGSAPRAAPRRRRPRRRGRDADRGRTQEHGVEATKALVDLGSLSGAKELMRQAVAAYGRIDVLVNNVGGTIWIKPFHLYSEEEVIELERSLYPTLWGCLAVLPIMMQQSSGSIVNLGSQSTRGLYRLPYAPARAASWR